MQSLLNLQNLKIGVEIQNIIKKCKPTRYKGIYKNIEINLKHEKKLIVIIGPTKSGKTTLIRYLSNYYPRIKTATTRPKRNEDLENEYIWLNVPKDPNESIQNYINRVREKYDLIEINYFAGNLYGTPRNSIEKTFDKYNLALITSENNGARQLINLLSKEIDIITLFVLPDSLESIEKRIGNRNNMNERIQKAQEEIKDSLQITNFFIHNTELPIYTNNPQNILTQTLTNTLDLIKSIESGQIN